jgi:hypothetical protein
VMRFVYGETSFLLTGDLAARRNRYSLMKHPLRYSRWLIMGRSTRRVRPSLTWFSHKKQLSLSARITMDILTPGVLERLRGRGAIIHRTDERGDISYTMSQYGKVHIGALRHFERWVARKKSSVVYCSRHEKDQRTCFIFFCVIITE